MSLEQKISLHIAEKLREIATRQGNVPFRSGDLRKSIIVRPDGRGAVVGSNLPYARAVHDGRPRVVIRPKRKKALRFKGKGGVTFTKKVTQPARKGNPFLQRAADQLQREGLDFLRPLLLKEVGNDLADAFIKAGFKITKR